MDAQGRRLRAVGALALLALAACGTRATAPEAQHAGASTSAASSREALPFIHDDYPKALAEAKRRNKPLFVDAWAPWCHSCQSLRTYVLTDPSLAPLANDFVWLSVDTEKDANASFVAGHPHSALPTLWVIDPVTDRPLLKWAGTATAGELRSLLAVSVAPEGADATAAFVRGNHALAAGDTETAVREHRAALAASRPDHPHRARIVEALVTELSLAKDNAGCVEVAAAEASSLPLGTSRASVLVTGIGCARDAKRPPAEIARLLELCTHDAGGRDASLLPDDRAALYQEIVETRRSLGDEAGAKATAAEWATFLDDEAKRAATKDARASLDPWRLSAALALGEPARAIPMLEESARDFPEDYNPPARLGRVYLVLARLDEAAAAADRAIVLVYGPRAMRVYELRADIAKARGDRAAEVRALEEALAKSEHAVLTTGQQGIRRGLAARLAALR